MASSRGFGELGSTKRDMQFSQKMKINRMDENAGKGAELDEDWSSEDESLKKQVDRMTCPNC
jgi:hypothetical protein